ncbi:hypothetical protein ACFE04_009165 [Oxalis oulophora]
MEDQCKRMNMELPNWSYRNPEQVMLQSVMYTTMELEAMILSAKQEIRNREFELVKLEEILRKVVKERDEAKTQCQKLMVDKLMLMQQNQQGSIEIVLVSGTPTSSEEDTNLTPAKLLASKYLPEKGKLLEAVQEAGPLLQTLLLAGPLPQWRQPPPQLNSIDIPPVQIPSSSPHLETQNSFSSISSSMKRSADLCPEVSDSSPNSNKYQKLVHFH